MRHFAVIGVSVILWVEKICFAQTSGGSSGGGYPSMQNNPCVSYKVVLQDMSVDKNFVEAHFDTIFLSSISGSVNPGATVTLDKSAAAGKATAAINQELNELAKTAPTDCRGSAIPLLGTKVFNDFGTLKAYLRDPNVFPGSLGALVEARDILMKNDLSGLTCSGAKPCVVSALAKGQSRTYCRFGDVRPAAPGGPLFSSSMTACSAMSGDEEHIRDLLGICYCFKPKGFNFAANLNKIDIAGRAICIEGTADAIECHRVPNCPTSPQETRIGGGPEIRCISVAGEGSITANGQGSIIVRTGP
jgi:hypothetical protein